MKLSKNSNEIPEWLRSLASMNKHASKCNDCQSDHDLDDMQKCVDCEEYFCSNCLEDGSCQTCKETHPEKAKHRKEDETVDDKIKDMKMDEERLASECDKIEICAKNGKSYLYNDKWQPEVISHLREYSLACKLPKTLFKPYTPHFPQQVTSSQKENMMRTASTNPVNSETDKKELTLAEKLSAAMPDPFHIEERVNAKSYEVINWEKVTLAAKLAETTTQGITPLRGGEDYNANSDVKVAPGQNSITDPDAIGSLIKSEKLDNGVRLKNERIAKEAQMKQNILDWQKEKMKEMPHLNMVSKGKVFPTEVLNAQSGLNSPSSQMGVYAKFDPKSVPERTVGENIGKKNEDRKASIQLPKAEVEPICAQQQSMRSISDDFAIALAKNLKGK